MAKIWEDNVAYTVLRPYVDATTHFSTKSITVEGEENIPQDGAVILAPNHCNTLMDALVVLQARKEPTVFGARADIFRKKKAAAALRFLKILPLTRARDGIRAVIDNEAIIEEITDTLAHGVKFCMFSEGTHRAKHSLLPIKKGITRIALRAVPELQKAGKDVFIVPMGIEYGDYFRFKTSVTLRYGEAINVSEYLRQNPEMLESEVHKNLTAQLAERMASLITYLPDDANYDADWTLFKIDGKRGERSRKQRSAARRFEKKRLDAKVSFRSFGHRWPALRVLLKAVLAILALPAFLVCSVLSFPMWGLSSVLKKRIKDPAFMNTARFACKFALGPILFVIWALVFFLTMPWYIALILLIVSCYSNSLHYLYCEFVRILFSDIRLLFRGDLQKKYDSLKNQSI